MIVGHCHPEVVKCGAGCRGAGPGLRCADRGRAGNGRAVVQDIAEPGDGAHGELRHRGDNDGDPPGARLYGRSRIIKFEGCYHGHSDGLLVKAASGALTFGQPSSSGVARRNRRADHGVGLQRRGRSGKGLCRIRQRNRRGDRRAGRGQQNLILPKREFLDAMRSLCTKHGAVLILDEVMSGFRVGLQGAHGYFGVKPDLITLGKVMGGGLPAAAFGGRRDIMQCLAPLGAVYQAARCPATRWRWRGVGDAETGAGSRFFTSGSRNWRSSSPRLERFREETRHPFSAQSIGSMFGVYFSPTRRLPMPRSWPATRQRSTASSTRMLEEGVYLAPSAVRGGFRLRRAQRCGHRRDGRCRRQDFCWLVMGCFRRRRSSRR